MEHDNPIPAEADEPSAAPIFPPQWLLLGWMFVLTVLPARADQIKANNNNNLELDSSWNSGPATTANVAMAYTNTTGSTLSVTAANTTSSLLMTSLTLGSGTPTMTFNLGGLLNQSVTGTPGANSLFYRVQIQ